MKRGFGSAYSRYSHRMDDKDQPCIYDVNTGRESHSPNASHNGSCPMLCVSKRARDHLSAVAVNEERQIARIFP